MKLVVVLVVIAGLTIGASVAWSAIKDGKTPSNTTPSAPSTTAPRSQQHPKAHCPNMGSNSGSSSNTTYSTSM
jgi:hypothetical protein